MHRVAWSCVIGLLLFSASSASAQTPAIICGTVTDPAGLAKPGVAVTLALARDPSTPSLVATTDAKGDYLFPKVPAGQYSLTFFLDGFKKVLRPGLMITAGFELRADMRMEPGLATENLSIPAFASVGYVSRPSVQTGASFSRTISVDSQPVKGCR